MAGNLPEDFGKDKWKETLEVSLKELSLKAQEELETKRQLRREAQKCLVGKRPSYSAVLPGEFRYSLELWEAAVIDDVPPRVLKRLVAMKDEFFQLLEGCKQRDKSMRILRYENDVLRDEMEEKRMSESLLLLESKKQNELVCNLQLQVQRQLSELQQLGNEKIQWMETMNEATMMKEERNQDEQEPKLDGDNDEMEIVKETNHQLRQQLGFLAVSSQDISTAVYIDKLLRLEADYREKQSSAVRRNAELESKLDQMQALSKSILNQQTVTAAELSKWKEDVEGKKRQLTSLEEENGELTAAVQSLLGVVQHYNIDLKSPAVQKYFELNQKQGM